MPTWLDAETARVILVTLGSITVALITAGFGYLAVRLSRIGHSTKEVKEQVVNGHGEINLREEADSRHDENKESLKLILEQFVGVQADIRGIRRDVGRLADGHETHSERILNLEQKREK